MGNAVYIAGLGPHSGKSVVAIGLVDMLLEKAEHVAYYKPVSRSDNDVHIKTILKHFGLPLKQSEVYACSWEQAAAQWKSDTREIFLDLVIRRFRRLSDKHELTVVEGSDYAMGENDFEFEMNVQMAKNLQAQMIIVTTAEAKTPAEVVSSLLAALHNLKTQKVTVLAVIVNKTAPGQHIAIQHLLTEQLPPGILHGLIADDVNLRSPTIGEITRQMRGRLLSGKEGAVNHADNFLVGVMQVPHFLTCLKKTHLLLHPLTVMISFFRHRKRIYQPDFHVYPVSYSPPAGRFTHSF